MAKREDDLTDYYTLLEVLPSASQKEIQQSFRKLAAQYHPDVNKDPGAEAQFKKLVEAYIILKNPEKRDQFDARIISSYCRSYLIDFSSLRRKKERPVPEFLRLLKGHKKKEP